MEPQITIGLLADATGFPLMVHVFEGNRGETTTMVPVLEAFTAAHRLADVTIVADTGIISAAIRTAIEAAELSAPPEYTAPPRHRPVSGRLNVRKSRVL